MTNAIGEIEQAKVILVTGSNTTENHPVIGAAIKRAVQHHGARLIVVDPRKIELAEMASLWLHPRPGTDIAWINGLIKIILDEDLYDKTTSNPAPRDSMNYERLSPPSPRIMFPGLPGSRKRTSSRQPASMPATGPVSTIPWESPSTATAPTTSSPWPTWPWSAAMSASPGQASIPARAEQCSGACDMGGLPDVFSGYQKVDDPAARKKMEQSWGVSGLSGRPGLTLMEIMQEAQEKKIRVCMSLGRIRSFPTRMPIMWPRP